MSSIPASELVNIVSRVIGAASTGLKLNGVILTKNTNLPVGSVISMTNSGVGNYFELDSKEYEYSINYFNADDNSTRKPENILFARYLDTAVSAWIRGAKVDKKISELNSITDGALNINISGQDIELSAISFAGATSYSEIAQIIQTALQAKVTGATVQYTSKFSAFIITDGTTGINSTIAFPTAPTSGTDLAEVLSLYEDLGAILSQGSAAMTPTENMEAIIRKTQNWFSFMPVWQETDDERMEIAVWNNSKDKNFMYCANEINITATFPDNANCFAGQVKDFEGICNVYNSKNTCAAIMGIYAAINWTQRNARKTAAYKTQGALVPSVTDKEIASALLGNGYNFYGLYATKSDEFNLIQNGQITGSSKWIDTYTGHVWLNDALQNIWLYLLRMVNTLPYNDDGYGSLRTVTSDVTGIAITNGTIRLGISLDNSQLAVIENEVGFDISQELYNEGYYLLIVDPPASVRAERGSPDIALYYTDGGSIQKITGTTTSIL